MSKGETPEQPALPGWLRRDIETKNPTAFGKHAGWRRCPKCRAWCLAGWDQDHDYAGWFMVDPTRLTAAQEAMALGQGRTTHLLVVEDGDEALTLRQRNVWNIRARPPEAEQWPVLPAHACGQALGAKLGREHLGAKGLH